MLTYKDTSLNKELRVVALQDPSCYSSNLIVVAKLFMPS